jgi:hypothetical protein
MVFRAADLAMKPRLSIAFGTGLIGLWMAAPPASDAGPCRHDKAHDCFQLPATLDFASAPDIANKIVSGEPDLRPPRGLEPDPPPGWQLYTGPMIGANSRVGAPTVGYYWPIH